MSEIVRQTIQEKIRQRRRQMLVHSYIYYNLDDNIVSDSIWSRWAKELEELQIKYPKESAEVEYAEEFQNWDGSSGAFLNFGENIQNLAVQLLEYRKSRHIKSPKPIKKIVTAKKKKNSATMSLF